jgi:hypothetical protein
MKLTRFTVAFAAALALAACSRGAEDQPAIDETTPAPAPAPAPVSPDTSMMHMDTTATSTTTGL